MVKISQPHAHVVRPFCGTPRPVPAGPVVVGRPDAFGADTHASYKGQLRGLSDGQLKAERARLQAVIADASSGPNRNPGAVARAKAQLGEVNEETAARAGFAKSSDPAYARRTHQLSDKELATERARQLERYREATTGLDRDPAKAADAQKKLELLSKESFGRFIDRAQGALPKATPTKPMNVFEQVAFHAKAHGLSDAQLAQERAKLKGEYRDASTGAHRDPVAAANARKKLEILDHVAQARRPHTRPIGLPDVLRFAGATRQMGVKELEAQVAKLQKDVANGLKDPVAANNARQLLPIAQHELATHQAELARYGGHVKGLSDQALGHEVQVLEHKLRAVGQGPAASRLLEQLDVARKEQLDRAAQVKTPPQDPVDGMNEQQLFTELFRQAERYLEASTGLDQDPVKARQSLEQIGRVIAELLERAVQGQQPRPEHMNYK